MRGLRGLPGLVACAAFSLALVPLGDAVACGAFFAGRASNPNATANVPFLSHERVLVVWDETTKMEHFVREVRFDGADQSFGFVVPVPSRPKVDKVASSPFDALARDLPAETKPPEVGLRPGSKGGPPGGGAPPPAVIVLETRKVGRFTAFVLQANDTAGFQQWLEKHGFTSTPESRAWLDEYVKRKFHYVAFRVDPPAKDEANKLVSETIRISFPTPAPYYPYREPEHSTEQGARALEVWFVSQKAHIPIATVPNVMVAKNEDGSPGAMEARRPWAPGIRYDVGLVTGLAGIGGVGQRRQSVDRSVLVKALGPSASLLPRGDLVVQTFRDFKKARHGYGDVLLVPEDRNDGAFWKEARPALYGILDPMFVGGAP